MIFFKPKKKILLTLLLFNLIFYSEKPFSQQVADTLMESFQCNTPNNKTMNMLNGLDKAISAVQAADCQRVRESLDIPSVRSIITSIESSHTVLSIKKQQSYIKLLLAEIEKTDDLDKKHDFQQDVKRAHAELLRLQGDLEGDEIEAKTRNVANAIEQLNAFADNMIQIMNDDKTKTCFENNELTQQAMASLTGIAGLMFSSSTVGVGLMAASKIIQKVLTIDTPKGDNSATDSTKLSIGLRCALQNINSTHCVNIRSVSLLDLTEANALCTECQTPEVITDANTVIQEMGVITQLSHKSTDNKQRFIRNFRKFGYVDRLKNITNFLQNIDDDFFDTVALDFTAEEIKKYIDNIASISEVYQKMEKYSTDKSKKKELETAKEEFYNKFAQLKGTNFFDINELTDFVNTYSQFQADKLKRSAINTDALSYINMDIIYDVLALSRDGTQRDQKTAIRDSRDNSRAALEVFSKSFKPHMITVLNNKAISMHSKSELCIRLLGIPDISEIKDLCKNKFISDSGKDMYFIDYMDKPHKERVCAYENFLRKEKDYIFPPELIKGLIKQSK